MVLFASLVPRYSISLTSSVRYILSIAPTLKSYANCCRYLTRLSVETNLFCWARVRHCQEIPCQSDWFQSILTSLFRVCPDCCVMSFWLQCSQTNTSWEWLDCLYRCMIKYRKAACTVILMMNTQLFETRRRQCYWIESLMNKVCILLVLLTCVYHDARFRTQKIKMSITKCLRYRKAQSPREKHSSKRWNELTFDLAFWKI